MNIMSNFVQSASVEFYSKYIVLWLLEMGYKPSQPNDLKFREHSTEIGIETSAEKGTFSVLDKHSMHRTDSTMIQCKDNVTLFLGLAALRTNTSKKQYFMTDITDSRKISVIGEAGSIWVWWNGFEPEAGDMLAKGYYHKMSVDELLQNKDKLKSSYWTNCYNYLDHQYGEMLVE